MFVFGGGYVEYCKVLVGYVLLILVGLSLSEVVVFLEIFFIVWMNVFDCSGLMVGECFFVYGGMFGIGIIVI